MPIEFHQGILQALTYFLIPLFLILFSRAFFLSKFARRTINKPVARDSCLATLYYCSSEKNDNHENASIFIHNVVLLGFYLSRIRTRKLPCLKQSRLTAQRFDE